MKGTLRLGLVVVALALPSALFLWVNSDAPMFCSSHDDCLYFVSAKSLAEHGEYRIESLPGEPFQTKYPPLYPLLLSFAWRINPQFPANLTPAVWISWAALPVVLFLLGMLYERMGLDGWRRWVLLTLIAVNPYTLLFTSLLLSDVTFTAFLLGGLLLAERAARKEEPHWMAGAAGAVMGLAYLTRAAGIAAFPAILLVFALRKRRRHAMRFVGAMLPFVAAWMWWAHQHKTEVSEPALMYYLDYAGYQALNVPWRDLPLVVWKNIDSILWAMAAFVMPKFTNSLLLKCVSQVIAVAMIAGIVRKVRRGEWLGYSLFALFSFLILALWHFPGDERFVYPIYPLALAGLLVELQYLATMLRNGMRRPELNQRVAAGLLASVAVSLLVTAAGLQLLMVTVYLANYPETFRHNRNKQIAAYDWIKRKVPSSALIMASRDPALYLYTGRHALSRQTLTTYWYHQDRKAILESFRGVATFARKNSIEYLYFANKDFGWAVEDDDFPAINEALRNNPELEPTFREDNLTVYKVRPPKNLAGTNRPSNNRINQSTGQNDH